MNLKILQYVILFNPLYTVYFNKQFLEFSTHEKPQFFIKTELTDHIEIKGQLIYKLKNNENVYQHHNDVQIVSEYDGKIRYSITRNDNTYFIEINKDIEHKEEIEYVLSARCFSHIVSKDTHLILHASAITYNDQAILFSSASGIGKTTIAKRIIAQEIDSVFINDDKPLVKQENHIFFAHGTPWAGNEGLSHAIKSPIKIIFFLEQGLKAEIFPMTNKEKIVKLIEHTQRLFNENQLDDYLSIIDTLINEIPIYRFITSNSQDDYMVFKQFMKNI